MAAAGSTNNPRDSRCSEELFPPWFKKRRGHFSQKLTSTVTLSQRDKDPKVPISRITFIFFCQFKASFITKAGVWVLIEDGSGTSASQLIYAPNEPRQTCRVRAKKPLLRYSSLFYYSRQRMPNFIKIKGDGIARFPHALTTSSVH